MKENLLTICIPTYNREVALLKQVQALSKQPEIDKVRVVVIDNDSPYDVVESLSRSFGGEVPRWLSVVRNRYNIGLAANLVSAFMHCDTEWCWILGDDDLAWHDALKTVLRDIETYPDVAMTKYNIPNFPPLREAQVQSISEFWDYYNGASYGTAGELVFVSNNLFNTRILRNYLEKAHTFSYTYIGHLIPIFFALKDGAAKVRFSPQYIVEYIAPDPEQHWSYHKVMMGLTTVLHLDLGLNDRQHREMVRLLGHIGHRGFALSIFGTEDSQSIRVWAVYKQMYEAVYRYERGFPLQQRLLYFTLWCHRRGMPWAFVQKLQTLLVFYPEKVWRRVFGR